MFNGKGQKENEKQKNIPLVGIRLGKWPKNTYLFQGIRPTL
jgi:hypothetical protein